LDKLEQRNATPLDDKHELLNVMLGAVPLNPDDFATCLTLPSVSDTRITAIAEPVASSPVQSQVTVIEVADAVVSEMYINCILVELLTWESRRVHPSP